MKHQARKRFGQNFLIDNHIINMIIHSVHPKPDENIVEIGPGLGAITTELLKSAGKLTVVELDRDLIPKIQSRSIGLGELSIHQADALRFDFTTLATEKKLRIVGNLPYNISTPLLFHLLKTSACIKDMYFMLQKEVVDRICANPGEAPYGRLSIMVQYHCEVEHLFNVSSDAFKPKPKVESAFIRITPHISLPHLANDFEKFADIVRTAFNQRRKTIQNSLKPFLSIEQIEQAGVDPKARPETLSTAQFVLLANT